MLFQRPEGGREGTVWYVKFWSPDERRYIRKTSTHTTDTDEARKRADRLLGDGVVPTEDDPLIADYLRGFWRPDSAYVRAKARRRKGRRKHSPAYLKLNASLVRLYVEPFEPFTRTRVSQTTPGLLEEWFDWMERRGKSGRVMNMALQMLRVGIPRWHRLRRRPNPIEGFEPVAEDTTPRGSLSLTEIKAILAVRQYIDVNKKKKDIDPRARAGAKLSILAGFRVGECRGLRREHVRELQGVLDVQKQVAANEKEPRDPKSGSSGEVPAIDVLLEELRDLADHSPFGRTGYVLYSDHPEKPVGYHLLANGFRRMMAAIGISEEERKRRNLSYHSTRHAYVSLSRLAGVPLFIVQQWARQKTAVVTEEYSHSNILDMDEARKKLGKAITVRTRTGTM